jgi:hypothetical protein
LKSFQNLGFAQGMNKVVRPLLPLRSRDGWLQRATVLEKPLPSGAGDLVFGGDFIKHNLGPWTAPGIELLLTFYIHQLGKSIPGLKRALIDFPG